ncbi:MAG: 4'-phosphopantetheinyl transferase superfamily protein [Spirochaetota bacterium]
MSSCDSFFAVLLVPPGYSMAVDIEQTSRIRDMEAIAGLAFEPLECRMLQQLEAYPDTQRSWFYRTWTTKEAVLKLGSANIFLQAKTVRTRERRPATRAACVGTRMQRGHTVGGRRGARPAARDMARFIPDTEEAARHASAEADATTLRMSRPVHTCTVRLADAITLTLAGRTPFPALRIVTGGIANQESVGRKSRVA